MFIATSSIHYSHTIGTNIDFIRLFIEILVVYEIIFQDSVSKDVDFKKFIPYAIPCIFLHETNLIEIYIISNVHSHSVCAYLQFKLTSNYKNVKTNVRFNERLNHCSSNVEK